jgi:hypothetical protein
MSASDTAVEISGSLGSVVERRAHRSQSGGSPRERVVRVADSDTVREWTLRPKEKKGMDRPSAYSCESDQGWSYAPFKLTNDNGAQNDKRGDGL